MSESEFGRSVERFSYKSYNSVGHVFFEVGLFISPTGNVKYFTGKHKNTGSLLCFKDNQLQSELPLASSSVSLFGLFIRPNPSKIGEYGRNYHKYFLIDKY